MIEILAADSQGDILTVRIPIPGRPGAALLVMAEVTPIDRVLYLTGPHIYGENLGPGDLGTAALIRLARQVMEEIDVDEIRIEGAVRITGANPGRRKGRLWISRRVRVARP